MVPADPLPWLFTDENSKPDVVYEVIDKRPSLTDASLTKRSDPKLNHL